MRSLRRSLGGLLVALLLALGLVVLGPATAYACDCATATPRSAVRNADVVVEATVVDKVLPRGREGMAATRYLLEVHSVLKGEATQRVAFASHYSGAACGLEGVEVRDRGVFFLYRPTGSFDVDFPLVANLCGGSLRITEPQVVRVVGAGREVDATVARAPEPGGPDEVTPEGTPWTAYGAGGLAALLAVGAGALWWRRRRA